MEEKKEKETKKERERYSPDKVKKEFPLSGGYYEVWKNGQIDPSLGNKVQVELGLYLPSFYDGEMKIDRELRFHDTLIFSREKLYPKWGSHEEDEETYDKGDKGYRCKKYDYEGTTWKEAFDKAIEHGEREFAKLEAKLQERVDALKKADFFTEEEIKESLEQEKIEDEQRKRRQKARLERLEGREEKNAGSPRLEFEEGEEGEEIK